MQRVLGRLIPCERDARRLGVETSSRRRHPRSDAVEDQVRQPYGIVHGGAILTLAESLTSVGHR